MARSAVVPNPTLLSMTASTTASQSTQTLVRSSPLRNAAVCKGDVGRLEYWRPRRRRSWRRWRIWRCRGSWSRWSWRWQGRPSAVLSLRAVLAAPAAAAYGPGGAVAGWRPRRSWRQRRIRGPAAPPQPPVVLSRNGKGLHRNERHRTSWHRDQGDHRKADRVPLPRRNWTKAPG